MDDTQRGVLKAVAFMTSNYQKVDEIMSTALAFNRVAIDANARALVQAVAEVFGAAFILGMHFERQHKVDDEIAYLEKGGPN